MNNREIPNHIHKIWLGSGLKKNSRNRLKTDADWFRGQFQYHLWIDKSLLNQKDFKEIENFCNKNEIKLRDVSELKDFENEKAYQFEAEHGKNSGPDTHYAGYVSASDILRYEILYHEGGIYLDLGDTLKSNIFFTFQSRFREMQKDPSKTYFNSERGILLNNFIVAAPKSDLLHELIDKINGKYEKLLAKQKLQHAHLQKSGDIEGSIFRLTGPDFVNKEYKKRKDKTDNPFAIVADIVEMELDRRRYPSEQDMNTYRHVYFNFILDFLERNNLQDIKAYIYSHDKKKYSHAERKISDYKIIKILINFQEIIDASGCQPLIDLFGSLNLNIFSKDSIRNLCYKLKDFNEIPLIDDDNIRENILMASKVHRLKHKSNLSEQEVNSQLDNTIVQTNDHKSNSIKYLFRKGSVYENMVNNINAFIKDTSENFYTSFKSLFFSSSDVITARVGLAKLFQYRLNDKIDKGATLDQIKALVNDFKLYNNALEKLNMPDQNITVLFDRTIKSNENLLTDIVCSDVPPQIQHSNTPAELLKILALTISNDNGQFGKDAFTFEAVLSHLISSSALKFTLTQKEDVGLAKIFSDMLKDIDYLSLKEIQPQKVSEKRMS